MNQILSRNGKEMQGNKKFQIRDMQSDDDNENISEDEVDQYGSRFNIQAAVSQKDPFKVSSKSTYSKSKKTKDE